MPAEAQLRMDAIFFPKRVKTRVTVTREHIAFSGGRASRTIIVGTTHPRRTYAESMRSSLTATRPSRIESDGRIPGATRSRRLESDGRSARPPTTPAQYQAEEAPRPADQELDTSARQPQASNQPQRGERKPLMTRKPL
jgi:hypothetical protein